MIPLRIFAMAVTLLLTACATNSRIELLPELKNSNQGLPPNHGLVVLRVADASRFMAYRINQVTFAPRDVNVNKKAKFPRAVAVDDGGVTSSTYIVAMPAGNYSIESLRSFHTLGQAWYSNFVPMDIRLGTFAVKPGELTNLGTVIFYPQYSAKKYSLRMVRNDSFLDATKLVEQRFSNVYKQIRNVDSPLGWDIDGFDDERAVTYSSAVQNPTVFNQVVHLENGQLAFPGRLGTTLVRDENRRWHPEALDNDFDVVGYKKTSQGEFIATEFNHLCVKTAKDKSCNDLPLPSGAGDLVNMTIGNNGNAYIAMRSTHTMNFFRSENPLQPSWQLIGKLSVTSSLGMNLPIYSWQFVNTSTDMFGVLAMDGIQTKIFNVNFSSNSATIVDNPSNNGLGFLNNDTNTSIELSHQNGFLYAVDSSYGNSLFRSPDRGYSWIKLDRQSSSGKLSMKSAPHFWDANIGYALSPRNGKAANEGAQEYNLYSTLDGGNQWAQVDSIGLPEGCSTLVPNIGTGKLLLHCPASGDFYLSTDSGKTWLVDRSTQAQ